MEPKQINVSDQLQVGLTEGLQVNLIRGAETWQFFAFVFAALVTFSLTLLDELPDKLWGWRLALKAGAFLVIGYATLRSRQGREWLVRLLDVFKTERRVP